MSLTLKKFPLVKDWSLSWIKWKDISYSPIINWHQFYFWRLVQIYFCSFHWCAIQQWEVYCSVWSLSALPMYTGKVSKNRAAKEFVITFQNDLQNIWSVFSWISLSILKVGKYTFIKYKLESLASEITSVHW